MNTFARRPAPRQRARGLTLVELIMAVLMVGVLVALVTPSMREMIASQRVRSINAELVTDLQFVRSEAVRMNRPVLIAFEANANQSCYTLYVRGVIGECSCSRGAGNACRFGPTEIKTVSVPRRQDITLAAVSSVNTANIAFEPPQGLPSYPSFTVDVVSSVHGKIRTTLNALGRMMVCSPDGSISGAPLC